MSDQRCSTGTATVYSDEVADGLRTVLFQAGFEIETKDYGEGPITIRWWIPEPGERFGESSPNV